MSTPLKTPVAFIIFNRPDCTRKVFERIRDARPEKLYLIADGPRPHKPGEGERCAETRRIVEGMIDWPCDVHRNYAEQNMGCRKRIVTGLRWVFENEAEAIILEDDIVANPSFFRFCQTMLEQYRNDGRVMQISGFKEIGFSPGRGPDFFFSEYTYSWGWATWSRAFGLYKTKIANNEADMEILRRKSHSRKESALLISRIEQVEAGRLDTWDYHWRAAVIANGGLSIIPAKNLVKNIGFGPDATHTLSPLTPNTFRRSGEISPPYCVPANVEVNTTYDRLVHGRRTVRHHIELVKDVIMKLFSTRRVRVDDGEDAG